MMKQADRSREKCGRRSRRGQSLAELAASLIVFVPIILLLIDCSVLMIGVSLNESACRDAARAAASGPPGAMSGAAVLRTVPAGSPPYSAALAVLKSNYNTAGLVAISQTMSLKETVASPLPQAPQGGPVMGTVSVETTASVNPPFLLRAFVENGSYQFKSTQSFPYTYIMPHS